MTIADGRRRLVHAQAKRAELRVARESGELVEVREVELRWSQLIVMARTKMLAIPSRVKQRLPHLSNADLLVLDVLIREALEELADRGEPDESNNGRFWRGQE
jgi:phage terminase Nu1 subunit (DNA packaging protein)